MGVIMNEIATIEQIKKEFDDEWVLVEVIEENELGETIKGKVITHSKARDEVYDALKKNHGYTHVFFTGEVPKKGYAFAF